MPLCLKKESVTHPPHSASFFLVNVLKLARAEPLSLGCCPRRSAWAQCSRTRQAGYMVLQALAMEPVSSHVLMRILDFRRDNSYYLS